MAAASKHEACAGVLRARRRLSFVDQDSGDYSTRWGHAASCLFGGHGAVVAADFEFAEPWEPNGLFEGGCRTIIVKLCTQEYLHAHQPHEIFHNHVRRNVRMSLSRTAGLRASPTACSGASSHQDLKRSTSSRHGYPPASSPFDWRSQPALYLLSTTVRRKVRARLRLPTCVHVCACVMHPIP